MAWEIEIDDYTPANGRKVEHGEPQSIEDARARVARAQAARTAKLAAKRAKLAAKRAKAADPEFTCGGKAWTDGDCAVRDTGAVIAWER